MILLLSSFMPSAEHDAAVASLIGKLPRETKLAYIENAYDVYHDEASLIEGRAILKHKGFDVELVDLRKYVSDSAGLSRTLASKDIFLLAGGNPYYLRWLMKASGADIIIPALVRDGKVYSGASAAAVVAGPTLRFFDMLDDPNEAKEIIWDGLKLTQTVVIPHTDNAEFGEGCRKSGELVKAAGCTTVWLTDAQALLINGDTQQVI
ncbi:MAG: Type 1 glutamine amidotransferase-like domain-containing protein [Chloroflexota bacterium]|nr:Type 1 glutamine amidotransferase-like domain-containing protein [Chloroflexota bacterium]